MLASEPPDPVWREADVGGAVACLQPAELIGAAPEQDGSARRFDDQPARRDIHRALPLDARDISVGADHGRVALNGKVATPADFDRAAVLAEVTGGRGVDVSKLVVDPGAFPSEPHAPATALAPDSAVAQAVRDAMFYDPRLDSYDVGVSVHDGIATLTAVSSNEPASRPRSGDPGSRFARPPRRDIPRWCSNGSLGRPLRVGGRDSRRVDGTPRLGQSSRWARRRPN
ncbi:MAG TPA: BON domain-containing protein [Polyangia bacterium]|nr:BON domain-containing protein [Polyangia bacterium]